MSRALGLLVITLLAGVALPVFAESGPETIESRVPGGDKNGEKKNNHQPEVLPELTEADLKLQPDEKLIYEIRVDGMPAGKAWLEVKKRDDLNASGGPAIWVTTLTIKSSRLISLTYEVDDKTLSKIDCKGGFSRFCHIERKDGEVEGEEISSFDYTFGNFKASYQRTRPKDRP
jgi:hypothetical protein